MRNVTLAVAVLVGIGLGVVRHSHASGVDWPVVPAPEKTTLTIVADDMEFNGVPMRTWSIQGVLTKERTFEFYRKLWGKKSLGDIPGFVEYRVDDWLVISRLESDFQITVQLDVAANSTHGLVGITKLPILKTAPVYGKKFQTYGNMNIVNDIESEDLGKKSRTIVATTDASLQSSLKYYRSLYGRKGWTESTDYMKFGRDRQQALLFNKRGKEVNFTISDNGTSRTIVVVMVDY